MASTASAYLASESHLEEVHIFTCSWPTAHHYFIVSNFSMTQAIQAPPIILGECLSTQYL